MMLGHGFRRHVQQNAVGIDQPDFLAMPRKRHRLPLHHCNANLVGQHAHHRGPLDPRNLLKLFAPRIDGNEKDVAAHVFAEDRHHLRAAHFGEAGGLNVLAACNAEARIALERVANHQN